MGVFFIQTRSRPLGDWKWLTRYVAWVTSVFWDTTSNWVIFDNLILSWTLVDWDYKKHWKNLGDSSRMVRCSRSGENRSWPYFFDFGWQSFTDTIDVIEWIEFPVTILSWVLTFPLIHYRLKDVLTHLIHHARCLTWRDCFILVRRVNCLDWNK